MLAFVLLLSVVSAKDLRIDLSELDEKAIGEPSQATGELVAKWTPESSVNPEELGEYLQGDILFTSGGPLRNGMKAEAFRWGHGVIAYQIKGDFDAFEMAAIEDAFNEYHTHTCIRFMPRTGREKNFLTLTSENTGCWSSVGRVGGEQRVNLQAPACLKRRGTVIHELMHAVGFLHEQNREDRDGHVSIAWQNIKKNHEHNFDKAPKQSTNDFGVKYDYGSVMHYSEKAFSVNGKPTIITKSKAEIGQREGLSPRDIKKINKMYNCQ